MCSGSSLGDSPVGEAPPGYCCASTMDPGMWISEAPPPPPGRRVGRQEGVWSQSVLVARLRRASRVRLRSTALPLPLRSEVPQTEADKHPWPLTLELATAIAFCTLRCQGNGSRRVWTKITRTRLEKYVDRSVLPDVDAYALACKRMCGKGGGPRVGRGLWAVELSTFRH